MTHMEAGWIDVSVPLRSGMVVWPGDPPVTIDRIQSVETGAPATVSRLDMGSHTGTHMDAPAHFIPGGATLDALPFDAVIGMARVLDVTGRRVIQAADLEPHALGEGERALLKTDNSARAWTTDGFMDEFVHLDEGAARHLAERRVRLVGIDYLSVAGYHDDPAPVHRTLLGAGVWIVEGLDLSAIVPGIHDLICVPIRLAAGDGAPARVLLRRREQSAGEQA